MVTKRAPAKPKAKANNGMTKEDACTVLQVAASADGEIITQAYGYLARKYQAKSNRDRGTRKRLEELNKAFLVLHPTANGEQIVPAPLPTDNAESISMAEFFAETRRLVARISSRWSGRAPEVIMFIITTAWLGFLALSSGANPFWTLLALAIAGATIWAPWRRAQS